jgi:CBS domain-containing protein
MNDALTVRDVLPREFVGVSESDPVLETVELLLEERVESAVVLRGSEPVGVLTERDVLSLLVEGSDPATTPVGEVMTPAPETIEDDATVAEAADRLSTANSRRLLVRHEDEVVGVLSEHDLLPATTLKGTAEPVVATAGDGGSEAYSTQSICEGCGALTRNLVDVSGQLLCADCRDV